MTRFRETHAWIREELRTNIEFWLKHGMDWENGGVYTCLDREGTLFSTDKSVWMQGRCGWIFAYLCTVYGVREEWLRASKSCLDFLEAHCINHEKGGRMYFTVTADGKPLRQRRYCFSEDFYTIANAEYYHNTGDRVYLARARRAYELTHKIRSGEMADPVGMPPKVEVQTRQSRSFGDPMIYLNVTSVMRRCDPEQAALYAKRAAECTEQIVNYHFRPELNCTLETVGIHGELQTDTVAGRVVNPGHDIEGSWFLLEQTHQSGNTALVKTAKEMFDFAIASGWDEEFGGILYFVDCMGRPPEAYEHDMKLWWPHCETLIAAMMLYRDTGEGQYLDWFYKTADYVKEHFADSAFGEWFGYLRREGVPTAPPCKGSTFKGPFHVPRSLIMVDQLMEEVGAKYGA